MVKVLNSGRKLTVNDKSRTQKKAITVVKLQFTFGFHWILLIFTVIEGPHQAVIWTVLNIFLTLQGVLIVLAQLLTAKNVKKVFYLSKLSTNITSKRLWSKSPSNQDNTAKLSIITSKPLH